MKSILLLALLAACAPLVAPPAPPAPIPIVGEIGATPSAEPSAEGSDRASSPPLDTDTPGPAPQPTPSRISFEYDSGVPAEQRAFIEESVALARAYFGEAGRFTVHAYADMENLLTARQRYEGRAEQPIDPERRQFWQHNTAESNAGVIFLNLSALQWQYPSARRKIVLHEYFHMRQMYLGRARMRTTRGLFPIGGPLWLIEGSAEYAAYRALAHYGLYDYALAREEKVAGARGTRVPLDAMERWNAAMVLEGSLYTTAFLAAEWLAAEHGEAAVLERFWAALGTGLAWESAFENALRTNPRQVYRRFEAYRREHFSPFCATVNAADAQNTALQLVFAGRLPLKSFPGPSEAHVPYAFCLDGVYLFALAAEQRQQAVRPPPGSQWLYNGYVLVLFVSPDQVPGALTLALELPDGRHAESTFEHRQ